MGYYAPEFITDCQDIAFDVLKRAGIAPTDALYLALLCAVAVAAALGGRREYVPRVVIDASGRIWDERWHRDVRIVRYYYDGLSAKQLADRFCLRGSTIRRIIERVRQLLVSGEPLPILERHDGRWVAVTTLGGLMPPAALDASRRACDDVRRHRDASIVQAHRNGLSAKQLALQFRLTPSTIHRIIQHARRPQASGDPIPIVAPHRVRG